MDKENKNIKSNFDNITEEFKKEYQRGVQEAYNQFINDFQKLNHDARTEGKNLMNTDWAEFRDRLNKKYSIKKQTFIY